MSMPLKSFFQKVVQLCGICFFLGVFATQASADAEGVVEKTILKLVTPYEAEGFDFRADIWIREITPEMGKGVRIQMFKGNEYRVIFAVPNRSKVSISAQLLDDKGTPIASKIEKFKDGSAVILHVTPKKTGVYMGVVRQDQGGTETVLCGMIAGYK